MKSRYVLGYYVRILTENSDRISIGELSQRIKNCIPSSEICIEAGEEEKWGQVALRLVDGMEVAVVERDAVEPDSLGAEEIQEFVEFSMELKPANAAKWLRGFLPRVKVIYAFQLLNGAHTEDGRRILDRVLGELWTKLGGVIQADNEGFTNLDGHQILWDFSDNAHGKWRMAVLNENDEWTPFEMELSDRAQRAEFLEGRIPIGAKLI